MSVDELLERHVNNTVAKDPSEEALRVYYEGVRTQEPYEAVRNKILDFSAKGGSRRRRLRTFTRSAATPTLRSFCLRRVRRSRLLVLRCAVPRTLRSR